MARKPTGFSAQSFLTQPGPGKTFKSRPPKHTVFSQGDKADAVYYLHDGKVKLTVVSAQGKEAVVGVLAAQQFFGGTVTGQRSPCSFLLVYRVPLWQICRWRMVPKAI